MPAKMLGAFAVALTASLLSSCMFQQSATDVPTPQDEFARQRLEQIKESKTFKVAACPRRKPFLFKDDNGRLAGIEIELVDSVARELDLKPIFFECPLDQIPGMLRGGGADLACLGASDVPAISSLYLSPVLDYMPSGQRLVARSESVSFITDQKQIDSDKITLITISGTTASKVAKHLFKNAKLITVKDFDSAISELKKTDNAAAIVGNVDLIARDELKSDEKVKPILDILTSENLALAIRRNDDAWRKILELGMRRAQSSGSIGRIIGNWFPNASCEFITLSADFSSGEASVKLGTEMERMETPVLKSSEKLPASAP